MDHPAIPHLKQADPVIGRIIDRVGKLPPDPRTDGTHLGALARAIVFQQLSGKAAGTIHGRFEALYGGRAPTPDELLATPDEKLRAAGLSRGKTLYLKDLAARAADGTIAVDRLHELGDDALMEALTSVKGIGKWTAQMFMMFRLGRPNVLPDLDLGVRIAVQIAYNLRRMPTPQEVLARGAPWSPYASFAAWYLWRSLELPETADARRRLLARDAAKRRKQAAAAPNRAATKRGPGKRPSEKRAAVKRASTRRGRRTRKTNGIKRSR
ncbi:MAG: DNA-3-methyladenine glycosylase family protein [Gemmatimonadales bacterium]